MTCLLMRCMLAGDGSGSPPLQPKQVNVVYTSLQMFANRKKPFPHYLAMHQRSQSDLLPDSHYSSLDV